MIGRQHQSLPAYYRWLRTVALVEQRKAERERSISRKDRATALSRVEADLRAATFDLIANRAYSILTERQEGTLSPELLDLFIDASGIVERLCAAADATVDVKRTVLEIAAASSNEFEFFSGLRVARRKQPEVRIRSRLMGCSRSSDDVRRLLAAMSAILDALLQIGEASDGPAALSAPDPSNEADVLGPVRLMRPIECSSSVARIVLDDEMSARLWFWLLVCQAVASKSVFVETVREDADDRSTVSASAEWPGRSVAGISNIEPASGESRMDFENGGGEAGRKCPRSHGQDVPTTPCTPPETEDTSVADRLNPSGGGLEDYGREAADEPVNPRGLDREALRQAERARRRSNAASSSIEI